MTIPAFAYSGSISLWNLSSAARATFLFGKRFGRSKTAAFGTKLTCGAVFCTTKASSPFWQLWVISRSEPSCEFGNVATLKAPFDFASSTSLSFCVMSPVTVSSVESFAMANSFGAAVAAAAANSMIHNTAVSVVSFFIYYTLLFLSAPLLGYGYSQLINSIKWKNYLITGNIYTIPPIGRPVNIPNIKQYIFISSRILLKLIKRSHFPFKY